MLNSVNIIGRLTKDPELKELDKVKVCNMRLAGKTRRGDPVFVDVSAFGAQAEACAKYLAKGSQVAVDGELRFDEWGPEGEKRSKLYLGDAVVHFLDPKSEPESKPKGSRRTKKAEAAKPQAA